MITNHPHHRAHNKAADRESGIGSGSALHSPGRRLAVSPIRRQTRSRIRKIKQVHVFLFVGVSIIAYCLNRYSQSRQADSLPQNISYHNELELSLDAAINTQSQTRHHSSSFQYDDLLYFDEAAMKNIRATFDGARSWLKWGTGSLLDVTVADKIDSFQAIPLLATVDRRPLTASKQMKTDKNGLHTNGELLGCAIQATTFLSKIGYLNLETMKEFPVQCNICFQFTNRHDMDSFVPGVGFEPITGNQESTSTKCFGGLATKSSRFIKWQSQDARFVGFGYPFTVDCTLPNGIKELTCREISKKHNQIVMTDDLQAIYAETKFTLDGYFGDNFAKTFHVFSRWPWAALQSHDDDRSKIAKSLPSTWDDATSKFVPSSVEELKFLHIEGPGYAMGEYDGKPSLESVHTEKGKKGGLHSRLLVNLFHLVRNAPQSTHMMAIVDGQALTSYNAMKRLLNSKLSDIYESYGNVFTESYFRKRAGGLIPSNTMNGKMDKKTKNSKMTLGDLLRSRGIRLHIVPVTSPSLSFEKSVCGGQYTFAAYLAARFAADYHVMMYVDGDTAMIEGSNHSLQEILYDRFFSQNSSKCAGHRIRLIEQFVRPEDDKTTRILQCTEDLTLNPQKWKYANENCHLKEGHIVARTDSILAMSVHHPDTDTNYVPEGIEDCITPGNKENDRYFLKADEFVQVHLRNRLRKDECVCFAQI